MFENLISSVHCAFSDKLNQIASVFFLRVFLVEILQKLTKDLWVLFRIVICRLVNYFKVFTGNSGIRIVRNFLKTYANVVDTTKTIVGVCGVSKNSRHTIIRFVAVRIV